MRAIGDDLAHDPSSALNEIACTGSPSCLLVSLRPGSRLGREFPGNEELRERRHRKPVVLFSDPDVRPFRQIAGEVGLSNPESFAVGLPRIAKRSEM
jgi:hypothetical protein